MRARRYALIAAICVFSTQFGVTVIAPLLGVFVSESENPYVASSLIFAAFTLVSTPLQIPAGLLSDKFGRKLFVVTGLILYAVASAVFLFFTLTHSEFSCFPRMDVCGFILARALQGAGAGFFFPAITAFLSENASENERKDVFSIYNIGLGAGLALGPLAGGFLSNTLGIASPFIVCVALAALSAALSSLFLRENPRSKTEAQTTRNSPAKTKAAESDESVRDESVRGVSALVVSCVIIFFGIGVAAIMSSVFSPFAKSHLNFSETLIGIILSAMLAVFSLLQHAFSVLLRKMHELHLASLGVLSCAFGLASLAFLSNPSLIFTAALVIGAGLGAISLSTLTLASSATPPTADASTISTASTKSTTATSENSTPLKAVKEAESGQKEKKERQREGKKRQTANERNYKSGKEGMKKTAGGVMGIYYTAFYAGLGIIPLICGYISEIIGARMVFLLYSFVLFTIALFMFLYPRRDEEARAMFSCLQRRG